MKDWDACLACLYTIIRVLDMYRHCYFYCRVTSKVAPTSALGSPNRRLVSKSKIWHTDNIFCMITLLKNKLHLLSTDHPWETSHFSIYTDLKMNHKILIMSAVDTVFRHIIKVSCIELLLLYQYNKRIRTQPTQWSQWPQPSRPSHPKQHTQQSL